MIRLALRSLVLLLLLGSGAPLRAEETHPARGQITVAFSPWDDAETLLLKTLSDARRSIHVQAYLLTSQNIADGLIQARQRGVQVWVLADAQQAENSDLSQIPRLAQAGVSVALETRYNIAHNKVMLVDAESDDCAVITGSYNFTQSARTRNAENLLVIKGDSQLAAAYLANWRRHQADAQAYQANGKPPSPRKPKAPKPALRFPWEGEAAPVWRGFNVK